MKNLILLTCVILMGFKVSAQAIGYYYDVSGNRVQRHVITLKSTVDTANDKQFQEFILDNKSSILVYPNPTSGILNFEVQNPESIEEPTVAVKIYSVNGSLIRDDTHHSNAFTIDLSGEDNGTYLLDMQVNGKKEHFTIIKN